MPDPVCLSLWFPRFNAEEMLPHALSVMQQFPSSAQRPGIHYLAVHPISWNEPTILERRFEPGIRPEDAIAITSDLLHEDYAYVFEGFWDLWAPEGTRQQWVLEPARVKFLVHGVEFDDGAVEQDGHIQVDFGSDTPFLHEELNLTPAAEMRVRANVQKLVEFTQRVEKNSGTSGRLVWSESEENLARKLLARLQNVQ